MNLKIPALKSLGTGVLFLAIVLTAVAGYAEKSVSRLTSDPRMVVIPVRSSLDIATDLENAQATKQLAIDRNRQAADRLQEIASAIAEREASVKAMDKRRDNNGSDKHSPEASSLKFEAEANKQAIELLKRVRDLRESEVEVAKVEEDHSDLAIRVLQMENELQAKRSDYGAASSDGTGNLTQNSARQVLGDLEESLLKLQQDLASSTEKVASKQKEVVNQRMKLHDAQVKLGI